MTKQTETNQKQKVLKNLIEINSIQRNGLLSIWLKELRGNKLLAENVIKNLNQRAKAIKEEKEKLIQQLQQQAEQKKAEEAKKLEEQKTQVAQGKPETKAETIKPQESKEKQEKFVENKPSFNASKDSKGQKQNNFQYKENQKFQPKNKQNQNQKNFNSQKPQNITPFHKTQNNFRENKQFSQNKNKPFDSKQSFASSKVNNFKAFAPEIVEQKEQRNFGNKNKSQTRNYDEKRGGLNKKQLQRRNYIDTNPDIEERMGSRKIARPKKKQESHVAPSIEHAIITTENVSVKTLSEKIGKPVPEIIKKLMLLGVMATINSTIDFSTAELIATELGVQLEQKIEKTYEDKLLDVSKQNAEDKDAVARPPVIAVMGHVDHGKTSLLDAIRKTNVASGEAGGITQKIGAYSITYNGEKLTFIDTPGHAAFTSMRARGAKITDIAVLVVAADDGVMPQTLEAISHIKAAEIPMIVAVNKMDAVDANIERIKTQLAANGVLPEEWGGDTIIVPISAKTGVGIENLISMILLVAEMQQLKANPNTMATGTIIEAVLDRAKGPIATVLVQNGTLSIGDSIMSGITFGKVKAMFDENGKSIKKATPSTPVAVLGFSEVPFSGEQVFAVSEKLSKQVIEERKNKIKEEKAQTTSGVTLDDFMNKVNEGKLKSLNIIIKADSQGSAEALKQSLTVIANEEVKVSCIHSGVGSVTESDLVLAKASGAVIINFNLKVPSKIQTIAEHMEVEIKDYNIIYEVVEEITKAITGMLSVKYEQVTAGHAEVKVVFKLSTNGLVAGSYVTDGKIIRNAMARLIRDGEVIADTKIIDLKIVKDDKSEVAATFECGIKLQDVPNLKEGDIIECYQNVEIKRG